jgi:hypothetical protein
MQHCLSTFKQHTVQAFSYTVELWRVVYSKFLYCSCGCKAVTEFFRLVFTTSIQPQYFHSCAKLGLQPGLKMPVRSRDIALLVHQSKVQVPYLVICE